MKYLIDTNILIWCVEGNEKLPKKIRRLLEDKNNEYYISIVTVWEIVMKMCKKNLWLNNSFDEIIGYLETMNFTIIPLKIEHLKTNSTLPMLHKDPFDRILVSTAITENLKFITSDKENHLYKNVKWIW